MGEVCYPESRLLVVAERGLVGQHERAGEVLTSSTVYNRRDRSACVSKFTEDVIEILREHSANGILVCDQVVCALGSRGLKVISSAAGAQNDSLMFVGTRTESTNAPETPAAVCCADRESFPVNGTEGPNAPEILAEFCGVNRREVPDAPETPAAFCLKNREPFSLNRTEVPAAPETPAAFCGEDRAPLSSEAGSSEISDLFLASPDHNELECHSCKLHVPSSPIIYCSQKGCNWSYHRSCAKKLRDCSWRKNGNLICPQHVCHACGGCRAGRLWKCERCPIASHELCCPWPGDIIFSKDKPGSAICWRHGLEDRSPVKVTTPGVSYLHNERTRDTKEVFNRLPILNVEDFTISLEILNNVIENESKPPPYTHIRRNVFLIKKKRDDSDDGVRCFCGSDGSECGDDCHCRVQSMSCSKDCVCKKVCTNKPYRKEKRLKVAKTELCGWGAKAAEVIRKGEFIIEYIGEVIDDALCEQRLWAMKGRGINNFYMCEIMKDFIIDATFKGNPSRYLNHSCQPNCKLEKWRVDGETRAGVFALRDISIGEPLTYNYKYVEFGPNVKCCCGAPNCRGAIGEKLQKTILEEILKWGRKGRRSCYRSPKRIALTSFEQRYWRRAVGTSSC